MWDWDEPVLLIAIVCECVPLKVKLPPSEAPPLLEPWPVLLLALKNVPSPLAVSELPLFVNQPVKLVVVVLPLWLWDGNSPTVN
mgnify:CR=1 FL=1